jgi:hypothetical protein
MHEFGQFAHTLLPLVNEQKNTLTIARGYNKKINNVLYHEGKNRSNGLKRKNRRGVSRYGILDSKGESLNQTNVFLIPPSYKKPRMNARVCRAVFAGFF